MFVLCDIWVVSYFLCSIACTFRVEQLALFHIHRLRQCNFVPFSTHPRDIFFAKVLQLDMGDWGDTISLQKFLNWQPKFRFSSLWKGHEKKSYLDMELLPPEWSNPSFYKAKALCRSQQNQSVRLKSFYEC